MKLFTKHWGAINFTWGESEKWGIHLFIIDRDQWRWGREHDELDGVITYWGLGPLGCVSRLNW